MTSPQGRMVLVGWIVGTHGVNGEVKARPCSGVPDRFVGLARLFLGPPEPADHGANDGEYKPVDLESARSHKGMALIRIKDIAQLDAARALGGLGLYLPASELPTLPEDEFYSFELAGLACESTTGECLGTVVEVLEMPASDVLLVRPEQGPSFLVPATGDIVRHVDVAGGRLVIDDRPGLR